MGNLHHWPPLDDIARRSGDPYAIAEVLTQPVGIAHKDTLAGGDPLIEEGVGGAIVRQKGFSPGRITTRAATTGSCVIVCSTTDPP
jgi:hypothetical protein